MTQLITTDDEAKKEYHRKRLLELSLKSLGEIAQLQDPDQEWVSRRMRNARSWEACQKWH